MTKDLSWPYRIQPSALLRMQVWAWHRNSYPDGGVVKAAIGTLFLSLWRIPCTPHHLLNHRRPHLLLRLTHSNSHIWQKRRMSDVWGVTVTYDIGYPLVLGCIGVTRTNITGLQGLEVLKCAKFISHFASFSVVLGWSDPQKSVVVEERSPTWKISVFRSVSSRDFSRHRLHQSQLPTSGMPISISLSSWHFYDAGWLRERT